MLERKAENPRTGLEIAVIGVAGRFPGAKNIREFWENLKNGVESISFFSDDELEKAGVGRELLENPNFVRGKGVLEDIETFDAFFFNYTSREAEIMDPQVRIFHQCAWSALEDAGYEPEAYAGRIGLYAGASSNQTWEGLCHFSGNRSEMGEWESMLLTDKDYMSVRISYKLNLKGPSFIMHSSCSTSLVAVHLGCRALLTGECDMALVGGVSISASRVSGYIYQEGMILSRDGHCRPFDAQASGTIGGEGIGITVLKRLDDAVAAGDHIYAVVKGSAINNDGRRKIGFSAPSIDGQVESIRSALHLSRIEPERIGYVEAHGTGTNLGDPVEIEALKMAFNTKEKGFCGIGSVKSNIGHLDVAAGIAGFIKTVLVLKHKLIPPSLHFFNPNPAIDFDNSPFYVNKELREWKNEKYPLSAGVSSFGIGGTNIHAILEEAPAVFPDGASPSTGAGDYRLLLLSAGSRTALDKMTGNWVDYLRSNPGIDFADTAYTLQVGRKTFNHRKMTVCRGTAEAVDLLSSHGAGKVHTNVLMKENPPVLFMFPGQGAQYVNMGLELYKTEAVFRQELDRCFEILEPLVNENIKAVLYPGESTSERINQTEITQPVIFAFEYALAKLLTAWGVTPYAMIGHSIGEYTAACLAGVFSLEDALNLVVWRGKLMQKVPSGAMLGVPLPEEELLSFLNEHISLAAVNSSSHCVVSGTHEAMDAFAADMKKRGYETSRLHTSHAFHSAMMDPVLEEFEAQVRNITFNKPEIPYISNVSGEWLTPDDGNNPGYWKRHLRETVRFSRGLEELLKEEHSVFIEVGPGKVLSTFVRQHNCKGDGHHTVHLIRHPKEDISDRYRLFNALGQIWLYGGRIDWEGFYTHQKRRRVSLPIYPFEGQRYWIDADFSKVGAINPSQGAVVSKKEDISDWFYLPTWRRDLPPAASKKKGASPGKRLWLVLMDDHGAGKELVKRLEVDGDDVICVDAGKEFQKAGDRGYIIDAGRPGDYHALFKDLKDSGNVPGTIVHLFLLSLTGEQKTVMDAESLESNFDKGFHSLIYLARAIEKQDITDKIRIEIVTNNMQDVTGEEDLNPAKSILLGACKTIPQEYPNIRCRSIDIVFTGSGSLAEGHLLDRLITEFKSDSTGALLAYRNNRRWVQVFEPLPLEKKEEDNPRLRPKGVYLVTGGLGRIGLIISGYLAEKVKAKLILISRSDFPPRDQWDQWLKDYGEENKKSRAIKKIKDFERSGAEVLVFSADVSDENRMREVINRAEEQLGPLNGVIHAAGILGGESYRLIKDIDKALCQLQFQPKISGLLVLHQLLQDKNPDFCLLTSSTSAILGGLTFTAYSAANIFMDAFAAWHNKLNPSQPWISVNWDGWREEDDKTAFEPAMTPGEGVEALERILSCEGLTHVVTSTTDLHAGIRKWINLESLQEEEDIPGEEPSAALYSRPNLTNEYVPPGNPVEAGLCEIWQRVFGFSQVGIHDNFFQLGGDSLKAINVSAKIHKTLNMKIPMEEFFNRQTIAELAGYIANSKETEFFSIDSAEEREYYELCPSQKGLYILQQLDEKTIGYNMAGIVKLAGFFDKEKLEQAFKKLIKRHESLRTAFVVADREPVQVIYNEVDFAMEFIKGEKKNLREIYQRFIRPFDLGHAPLLRVSLVEVENNEQWLMTDIHHIISDEISVNLLRREFMTIYEGNELPPLRLQYKDYSEWKNKIDAQAGEATRKQEDFWLKEFQDEIPVLNLPTDFPRGSTRSYDGDYVKFMIDDELMRKVKKIAYETGATLNMVLMAVYYILLFKYTNREDIVIGSPVSGRKHIDLLNIMGLFVNMLALRNKPQSDKTFRGFLLEVKQKMIQAMENQDYHFAQLTTKLGIHGSVNQNPLFDVVFRMNDGGPTENDTADDADILHSVPFDLILVASASEDVVEMVLMYPLVLFEKTRIEKITKRYVEILSQATANPDLKIKDIQVSHGLLSLEPKNKNEDGDFDF